MSRERTENSRTTRAGFEADAMIDVRVVPRAKVSAVSGMRGSAWLVRLQAPPLDGAANEELIAVLSNVLGVPKRSVAIVSGERSREKRVRIAGLDNRAAQERLSAASARS
jgi:uncharacterized protein (TIGR00251 family)